jgi:hypothetical protein
MPNGIGGIQGFHNIETYDLSVWLLQHKPVYEELKTLVRKHWDPEVPSKAAGVLREWFDEKYPDLSDRLWKDRPERSWDKVGWAELALYFSRYVPWGDDR